MKPLVHARSSVRRWGGAPEDYLPLHEKSDWLREMPSQPWMAGAKTLKASDLQIVPASRRKND